MFEVEELEILGADTGWRQAGKKKKPAVLLSIWERYAVIGQEPRVEREKSRPSARQWSMNCTSANTGEACKNESRRRQYPWKQADPTDDLTEEQLAAAEDIVESGMGGKALCQRQARPIMRSTSQSSIYPGSQECSQVWVQNAHSVYGWVENEEGTIQACIMDFNNEIMDGIPFNDVHTLEGSGKSTLGNLRNQEHHPSMMASQVPMCSEKDSSQSNRTGKVDSMKLVKNADGEIWIGEITGLSWDQLQKMVHRFVTACYCEWPEISMWKSSSAVLFKNFSHHQAEMIAACHLPEGFTSTAPKSHVDDNSYPAAVLLVQKWIDQSGKLQPPVDRTLVPLQVVRQWKYQKTPAPKCKKNPGRKNVKGKGKAQEEGVVDDSG
ncbi:hypothetical protein BKA82DRAFT_4013168 [Pisolithus tinctorius]|nr:hypothetical protein BKA82DRAFT_4013168 [Pisolithus tinctorius]